MTTAACRRLGPTTRSCCDCDAVIRVAGANAVLDDGDGGDDGGAAAGESDAQDCWHSGIIPTLYVCCGTVADTVFN